MNIEPGTLIRIRTADRHGLVTLGPLLRIVKVEDHSAYVILDIETILLSTVQVPHARP